MLRFFNTLSRSKEAFRPIRKGEVRLYTCGPSVYAHPHIGNYKTYLFEDVLKRYLLYKGYRVMHIMNITDVEDKSIREARRLGSPLSKITKKYTKIFFDETKKLCIIPADIYPRATQHVGAMVGMIQELLEKGYAYKSEGDIYYRISRFKRYGRLSRLKVRKEMFSRRLSKDDYEKWEAGDFILWKAYRKSDGDVFWDTPLGKGRPGWSIECSAMSTGYLGEHFDIHAGGIDNIFCHHENEIAQSEGATGRKFVNYWLHSRHLMVDGRKMSKSLGNCYTIDDLLEKGFEPKVIRYVLISSHYRKRLNFTYEKMRHAKKEIAQYYACINRIKGMKSGRHNRQVQLMVRKVVSGFERAMDDDLDTGKAIRLYFNFICKLYKLAEKGSIDESNKREIMHAVERINSVLGFLLPCALSSTGKPASRQ